MGSLVTNKINKQSKVTNDFVKKMYDNAQNNSYTRFMENAPVFVTYYKQSRTETTTDKGFGNVNTNIGISGKRFNKIEHVPLYGVDKSSFNLDMEEIGLKGSYHSEANMVLDCIEPIAEDYFTFEFNDGKYLFKVINVEIDSIESNNYFKVGFKLDKENDFEIEKQVVGNYTCIFENIGTEDKSVIKNEDYNKLEQLNAIYLNIVNSYMRAFHNVTANCFTFNDKKNDKFIYDPYVMEFIIRNQLFVIEGSLDSFAYRQVLDLPNDFQYRYKHTIYYNFEKKKEFSNNIRLYKIADTLSFFYRTGLPYRISELFIDPEEEVIDMYPYIHTNFTYEYNGDDIIFNTILKYIGINNKTKCDGTDDLDDLFAKITVEDYIIDNFEDFYCKQSMDYFVCVPMVLFIIKKLMNNININIIK